MGEIGMDQGPLRLIDLYVYRKEGPRLSFLLLKRAGEKVYAGQWRMIGGKVKRGEISWRAALREMREETGLSPNLFWSVPTLNHFYEASRDHIHLIPVFAAQVGQDAEPVLNDEHNMYEWVDVDEAVSRLAWPEQKRIVKCIYSILTDDKVINDWIIKTDNI